MSKRIERAPHVLFLFRKLTIGGAQRQLLELAKGLAGANFRVTVATFYDGGAMWPEFAQLEGVQVVSLGKKSRWDLLSLVWRFFRLLVNVRPDLLYGNMEFSNVLCLLGGRLIGARVIWAIQASNMDFSLYDSAYIWTFRLAKWLSRFADLIVANSVAGKQFHIEQGFYKQRLIVIPNGFDINVFRPDADARQRARVAWGVAPHQQLIGQIGRLDPMKDYPNFLRAAAQFAQQRDHVRFVCVGSGEADYTQELHALAAQLGLGDRLIWAGPRSDMAAVYNALDVLTSASAYGEGLANVLGEAMACGVPCVATDVGDAALIIAEPAQIAPPQQPGALVAAWKRLLDMPPAQRERLSATARERIVHQYSTQHLIRTTETALRELVPTLYSLNHQDTKTPGV